MYRLVLVYSAHPCSMQTVRGRECGVEKKNISLSEELQTVVAARHPCRDKVELGQGIEQGEASACHVRHEDRASKVAGRRVTFV